MAREEITESAGPAYVLGREEETFARSVGCGCVGEDTCDDCAPLASPLYYRRHVQRRILDG